MALEDTINNALPIFSKTAESSNGTHKDGVDNSNVVISPGSLVVVTGANGLMGGHVADQLLQRGYLVRGTVRSASRDQWVKEHFDKKYGPGKFELVEVSDMVGSGAFDEAVKGASGFVHAAAPLMIATDPNATIPIAVESTLRFLESAAKEPGIKRVVLTSSSGACSSPWRSQPLIDSSVWNEAAVEAAYAPPPYDEERRTAEVYYAGKTKSEQAAWKWVQEHKPSFTFNAVLPSVSLGPPVDVVHQGYRSTIAWIKTAFEKGEALKLKDLHAMAPQYYVDFRDAAAVHVAALVYPDVSGERLFAFASPFNWNDILRVLKRAHPQHKFSEEIPGIGRYESKVTHERAEELLKRLTGHGWISLEDSVKANAEGLAAGG
ncbi:NAD(P)-binding protein [Hypoxylon sp. FL0890]|nr:NAD(P)-binding protein [Hypoxylon sp. FL0890]